MNVFLWIVKGLMAAVFLFAGAAKLVTPGGELADECGLPGTFMHFIGICEVLGAAGLVVPGVLGVRRELTATAAVGLGIIMAGAVAIAIADGVPALGLPPLALGATALFVAWGRWPRDIEHGVPQAALRPTSERQWREEWEARLDRLETYVQWLQGPEGRARSDGSCAGC